MTPSQIIENFKARGYSDSMTFETYVRLYCDAQPVSRQMALRQHEEETETARIRRSRRDNRPIDDRPEQDWY